MPSNLNTIADADMCVRQELQNLVGKKLGCFEVSTAILFLHDPYGDLLEPVYHSCQQNYDDFEVVKTSVAPTQGRSGIASIAWSQGRAYSQHPLGDDRIGDQVEKKPCSQMAVCLGCDDSHYGVVAVYADHVVDATEKDEHAALNDLDCATHLLQIALLRRQALVAERDARRYSELVSDLIHQHPLGAGIQHIAAKVAQRVAGLFDSDYAFFRIATPEYPAVWFSSEFMNHEIQNALEQFHTWRQDSSGAVLNRRDIHPALYDTLTSAVQELAWCKYSKRYRQGHMCCVIARKINTSFDHWLPSDVELLERSLDTTSERLSRALEFDRLVRGLKNPDFDVRKSPFTLWCYLLNEFFGIDQVLVTKVRRQPDHCVIETRFTEGFGPNEALMYASPKKFYPHTVADDARPDVMVRIVSDYLEGRIESRSVYEGCCEEIHGPRFSLDPKLIEKCSLKGKILFVPCYTPDAEDGKPTLRSIIHLGTRSGKLQVDKDLHHVLLSLGERVAAWLSDEDEREVDEMLAQVRQFDEISHRTLSDFSKYVVNATHAFGCTIFLNALQLDLIDKPGL